MKIISIFCLCLACIVSGCDNPTTPPAHNSENNRPSDSEFIAFPGADRIVVVYAPRADFSAADIRRVEIEKAAVAVWLRVLGKIPRKGTGLMIKMAADAPEHNIDFFKGAELLGTLRMKAGKLDAPAREGWDFYNGEDIVFAKLVIGSVGY